MLIDDYLAFTISALAAEVASAAHYRAIASFFRIRTNQLAWLIIIYRSGARFFTYALNCSIWRPLETSSGEVAKGAAPAVLRADNGKNQSTHEGVKRNARLPGWLISSWNIHTCSLFWRDAVRQFSLTPDPDEEQSADRCVCAPDATASSFLSI